VWLDERGYSRALGSAGQWSADIANGIRDWLEKKASDFWATIPDDGTGEVDSACQLVTSIAEDSNSSRAGDIVSTNPSQATFNPLTPQLRHPPQFDPNVPDAGWNLFYLGFYVPTPLDGFPSIALHGARHTWQFTRGGTGGTDSDGELLLSLATAPPDSADLTDAGGAAYVPGGNGDGNFLGDNTKDTEPGPRTVFEHDAMRLADRLDPGIVGGAEQRPGTLFSLHWLSSICSLQQA
jgi:hypothetical protein